MFSAHFFGPLLFTCVGAFMGAERGDGERVLHPHPPPPHGREISEFSLS